MNYRTRVLWATTALVSGLMIAGAASAQSTGSQTVEATEVDDVVVTGIRGPRSLAGAIVAETAPKSVATVTAEYLSTQNAGQSALASINLLPGVNFTNTDAFGSSGGDITLRGLDAARISLTVDGIPLNDTGNYAIYSNQQQDPETLARVSVNLGTTDVDSPTASATGGTINFVTRRPSEEAGLIFQPSVGSYDFKRIFAMVDTGAFGPWGTTAWFSASRTEYDHFNAIYGVEKSQYNGRIYQALGANGDFLSLSGHYNENRNFFGTQSVSLAAFEGGAGYNRPSVGTGAKTGINPSNTGNIRGQSRFTLAEGLRLTIDPTFQYVLANGGGNGTFRETDLQLIGNSNAAGVDLNGDGDFGDTVTLYRPNTTNTHRYTVTSSLIWDINDDHRIRGAYTYENGRHRQTGQLGFLKPDGQTEDVFGGLTGRPVELPDGTNLRRRDRLSYAILNQFSLEYRGSFFDDAVDLVVGARAPYFKRELNNYCYQRDTFNAFCTTQVPTVVNADGTVQFPASGPLNSSANNRYGVPRSFEKKYDDILPNAGLTWRFAPNQSLYTSYAEGLSAPRTDDLYDRFIPNPQPETTKSVDLGYRYQSGTVIASAAVWQTDFSNRIVRTYDEVEDIFQSRNVGEVTLKGVDGQVGWSPIDTLTLYASASYVDSEVQNDLPNGIVNGVPQFIATAGKTLVETPEWQFGFRADYRIGDFALGLQGKHVGERFANDINTSIFPEYQVWDLDARYDLPQIRNGDTWIQLNVTNLFDERYLANINTSDTGLGTGNPGSPRAFMFTLHAAF
ncbi:TonB-dependent receptor [Brevundimonas sp. R86498]|uniref:TonB-dependent receptor n=1 Tax=Brevundimonas sp. R86498 TaxID=3093845 RepID=UPI0037C611F6